MLGEFGDFVAFVKADGHLHLGSHPDWFRDLIQIIFRFYQGAGKRPRQCCQKGLKTKEIATRGPEGPESGSNTRVRGPEGPEDEQNPVALASATICFSRFSQKSRFS